MINAGKLNTRIKIFNSEGSVVSQCWASVRPISAKEQIRNNVEIVNDLYTVLIRYRPNIDATMYVEYQHALYDIIAINADKQSDEIYLTIQFSNKNEENFKRT